MVKKIQMMSHDKEWQVVDGVETLVPVEQFDIDPVTDSSCVKIEGFRTLEETLNEKNMFTPEVNATKVMDKVGGEYHQNVVDGAYEEAILYGNTQVNLCEEDTSNTLTIPTTFTSFNNGELQINNKENQVVAPLIKGVTMVNLAQERSATFDTSNSYVIENAKGNTTYTVFFNFTVKNTNAGIIIQSYNGNTYLENSIHKTQLGDKVKFTFTTHSDANRFSICNPVAYGGQTIQLDDIMAIEGDQTALDIPYFKGMKSVELVRPLTNLFTNNTGIASNKATFTNTNGDVVVTSSASSSWASINIVLNDKIKPNTKYLVMWDNLTTTQTSTSNTEALISVYGTGNVRLGYINNSSLCPTKRSLIFDTQNYSISEITLRIHATLNNTETGTTTVTGLRIFEYDDYLRSVDLQSIGWFSGTKNVAVEPIKTCSKNLYPYGDVGFTPTSTGWFDAKGNSQMTGDIASKSHSRFLLKKGTYYFSIGSNTNAFCQLTSDKENMGVNANSSFTLQEDTYVTLRVKVTTANTSATVTNIQIERGETATAYVAHDSRYYEPNGQNAIVLRSLPDGICDTFNLQTGEYTRKIGEIIIDGSEDWKLSTRFSSTYNSYYFVLNETFRKDIKYANDKYQLLDGEDLGKNIGLHMGNDYNNIAPFISSDKMTLSEFKEYLQQNPVTVQYEIATPVTTIIPRTIKRNHNGTVSTVDFKTYTNKENLRLPKNPSYLTINSMTSIKPVVEPITYIDFKTRLKTNTDYSVIMDKNSTDKTINLGGTSKTYTDKMLVRTPSVNLEQNLRISGSGSIQNIMVIEGDVLDKELPYFNGICNVKMPIIRNSGKNLFDGLLEIGGLNHSTGEKTNSTDVKRSRNYINVKPNMQLSFTTNHGETGVNWFFYDANKKYISNTFSRVVTVPSGARYLKIYNLIGSIPLHDYRISIMETPSLTSHEPYCGNDIYIAQGEIGLSQDMFEQGGFSGSSGNTYDNCKANTNTNIRMRTKGLITVKPNTTYIVNNNTSPNMNHVFYLFDESQKYLGSNITVNAKSFVTPNNCRYVSLMFSKNSNANISVSEFKQELFQLLELDSTVQLRSLPNGVKDELNLLTGEYIQRVGEVVFDGSEDEGWHMEDVNVVNHLCFDTVYAGASEANPLYTNFRISDKFDSISHEEYLSDSVEGIRYFSIPAISISRSKLNEPNVTGFKQYLQQNPITVQYQLAKPIISYPRIVSNTQEREVGIKLPNGVCDTYNPSTGITVKRVGKVVLDGSENWKNANNYTNTYRFKLTIPDAQPRTGIVCHDMYVRKHDEAHGEYEYIINFDDAFYLNLLKTKLSTLDVAGVKTYLASNPITVWYELKNPIVTTDIVLPNGVHDEYNPLTGLYTKRVGFIEFDGSEDWHEPFAVPTSGAVNMYNIWTEQPLNNAKPAPTNERIPGVCDSLKFKNSALDLTNEEFYFISPSGRFNMNLSRSKLSEPTEQALKTYLSQNPIKLWYELQTPITYQLTPYFGLPMPYAYKDGYLIMDSAYNGQTLPPEIKYKLLANRTGQITQNNIKLQNHTSKLSNLEAMLVEATLQSMYEREMMAFNLEMVNINLINLEE